MEASINNATQILSREKKKSHYEPRLVLQIIAIGFGSTAFGYASAVIAPTLSQPSFLEYMDLGLTNPNRAHILGATNSLYFAGGFIGSFVNSWVSNRYGRKASIASACLLMIVAGALVAGSVHIGMFIAFRFFTGWSAVSLLAAVPMWITEVSPPHGRGILAELHAWMAILGYVLANYVGVGFYYYHAPGGNQWRGPLAFVCLFPLITLCFTPWAPESPRWLLMQGRDSEAFAIIQKLHRSKHDLDETFLRAEFAEMVTQVTVDRSLDSSWRILWTRPSYRKRALIACSLLSALYSSGIMVVANYGPTIYSGLGFSTSQSLQLQAGQLVTGLLALTISMTFVDRLPRNIMLGGGLYLCAIPLSIEAALVARFVGTDNKAALSAGVAFIFIFGFIYNMWLDGPGYFYASEIFPTHLRAKGATLCVMCYSLINILWTQVAPTAFANIGWKFYLVFVVCSVVFGTTILFIYPDTLNKPLEEVAAMFGDEDLMAVYSEASTHDHETKDGVVTGEETVASSV